MIEEINGEKTNISNITISNSLYRYSSLGNWA